MPHRRDSVFVAQMVEAAEAALEFSDGHTAESSAERDSRRGQRLVKASGTDLRGCAFLLAFGPYKLHHTSFLRLPMERAKSTPTPAWRVPG